MASAVNAPPERSAKKRRKLVSTSVLFVARSLEVIVRARIHDALHGGSAGSAIRRRGSLLQRRGNLLRVALAAERVQVGEIPEVLVRPRELQPERKRDARASGDASLE